MKYYCSCNIKVDPRTLEMKDSYDDYSGFDEKVAREVYESEIIKYDNLCQYDKDRTMIEFQIYDLPDEITPESDQFDILDALCECSGYNGETYYKGKRS